MSIVSSAEVQKNFGRFKEAARIETVMVTQYGKPAVVILDAAEYERLKELDGRHPRQGVMLHQHVHRQVEQPIHCLYRRQHESTAAVQ